MEILTEGTKKYKLVYDVNIVHCTCHECGCTFNCQTGEYLYTRLKEIADDGTVSTKIWLTCPFCKKYHNNYQIEEESPTLKVVDRSKVVNFNPKINHYSWAEVSAEDYGNGALYLNPTNRTVKNNITSVTFNVTTMDSTLEWDISKSESWMNTPSTTHYVGAQTLTLTFSENTNKKKSRTGYYYIDFGQYSKKFTLKQLSKNESEAEGKIPLSVSPDAITVDSNSGTKTFTVTCEAEWIVENPTVSWVAIQSRDGNSFTIKYGQNVANDNRQTTIRVKGKTEDTVVVDVEILQTAAGQGVNTLTVSPTSLTVAATGGNPSFTITSDTTWTITGPSWITQINPVNGSGNATVYLSVSANSETSDRDGEVVITGTDAGTKKVTVSQAHGSGTSTYIYALPAAIDVTHEGEGSKKFNVYTESTTGWTVSTDSNWITLNKTSGQGEQEVTFEVSNHTGTSSRTGYITVRNSVNSTEKQVAVTQSPPPSS